MTRALWVTAEPPDRNLTGGSIREAYLLEALGREVETHLLLAGTLQDPATRAALAGITEVDVVGHPPPTQRTRRRVDDLRRVFLEREPADVIECRNQVQELGRRMTALGPFDIVCVEHDRLAPLIGVRQPGAGRWALTLHNLPSERKRHEMALARTRRQRWLYRREHEDARRFQAAMAEAFDVVFVTSDADAAALDRAAVVIPNGVDTARFRPTPVPAAPVLVFTGMLRWRPRCSACSLMSTSRREWRPLVPTTLAVNSAGTPSAAASSTRYWPSVRDRLGS